MSTDVSEVRGASLIRANFSFKGFIGLINLQPLLWEFDVDDVHRPRNTFVALPV
jgi:hypothetical protein